MKRRAFLGIRSIIGTALILVLLLPAYRSASAGWVSFSILRMRELASRSREIAYLQSLTTEYADIAVQESDSEGETQWIIDGLSAKDASEIVGNIPNILVSVSYDAETGRMLLVTKRLTIDDAGELEIPSSEDIKNSTPKYPSEEEREELEQLNEDEINELYERLKEQFEESGDPLQ